MARRIPPLNQLRAFEAAARLGSFRGAGEELNVTHSAVSHQVKALEQYFGAPLFHREARGVRVTDAAEPLFNNVQRALDLLADGANEFKGKDISGLLRISVAPSFASRWLLKRLGGFKEKYPAISVEPDIASDVQDFGGRRVDLGIRHGFGNWRGLIAEKLFDEKLWLVGAPHLAAGFNEDGAAANLTRTPLLTASVRKSEWDLWLNKTHGESHEYAEYILYSTLALALDGAISGLGVTLADHRLVHDEIRQGRLMRIGDQDLETGRGFYLVWPKMATLDAKTRAFKDWLLDELS